MCVWFYICIFSVAIYKRFESIDLLQQLHSNISPAVFSVNLLMHPLSGYM